MNKIKIALVVLLIAILPAFAFADRSQAIYNMNQLLDKVGSYGYSLSDYGNGAEGDAWWAWNMTPQHYCQVDRMFFSDNEYLLVAAGDARVSDVDIKVYDDNWNLIAADTDSSSVAVARFQPGWDDTFHIRVIYYSGQPVATVGFFISYR